MPRGLRATTCVVTFFIACAVCLAPSSPAYGQTAREAVAVSLQDDGTINLADDADGLGDLDDADDIDIDDLLGADIDELGRTDVVVPAFDEQVTTVSRQESTVGRSPAAVYVITNDMIRRSGARSIPEALRLAPGVTVVKTDSNKWSISIRGFNERFANKLLVQIDGRSVYTPLFGGVFWEVQDVLLEDVDRIEVIRGPGATVWGANAVNGIINIITKSSASTQGRFAELGVGDERAFSSGRIGGTTASGVSWRAYGKWFERQEGLGVGFPASDDWRMARGGFRLDWKNGQCDDLTLQGDVYDGDSGGYDGRTLTTPPYQVFAPTDQPVAGGNALFRWSRNYDQHNGWSLMMYYDKTERVSRDFRHDRDTINFDFQQQIRRGNHQWIWGAGYRNTRDRSRDDFFFVEFQNRPHRADDILSGFLQDQITLHEDLWFLTLGSKFSWNDYTNFEYQPTVRLLYTPSKRESWWASVSRAVRTPTRAESDMLITRLPLSTPVFPSFPQLTGNPNLVSEQLLAYEIGVRSAPSDDFYWDFAAFFNHYEDLQATVPLGFFIDPGTGLPVLPLEFQNEMDAETYGFELAATAKMREGWTLRGGYSFLKMNLNPSALPTPDEGLDPDPRSVAFLHSSMDIGCYWELDLVGRYVDNFRQPRNVPAYLEMDARVAYLPNDVLELAVVGRNLLDSSHAEASNDLIAGTFASEVLREVFFHAALRY